MNERTARGLRQYDDKGQRIHCLMPGITMRFATKYGMFIGKLMQKGVILAPFCTFSEGKINLIRDKQVPPILAQNCNSVIYKQEGNQ